MPQLNSVSLTDRQPTPKTHTFTPDGFTPNNTGQGTLIEVLNGVVADANVIRAQMKASAGGRRKPMVTLAVPYTVTETVNGVTRTQVLWTDSVKIEYNFDSRTPRHRRNDIVGMVQSMHGTGLAFFDKLFVDTEHVW